jgi:trehalose monomycolate/heme transporter
MFEAWGRGLYRFRRLVLVISVLFAVAAGVWGTGVFGKLTAGNTFTPPGSESNRESAIAGSVFGRDAADAVVLFRSATQTVADPAYRQAVTGYLAALPAADIVATATFWTSGQRGLVSADGHSTYAVLRLAGVTDPDREDTFKAIKADFPATAGNGISAQVGGTTPTELAINSEVSGNIARAEGISFPVLMILLVIIFGSAVAALAPLAIGGLAILGSFTVLRLLAMFTPVSLYSVNITTIIGLGLGIDYGLFIVTRFREELRRQTLLAGGGTTPLQPPGKEVIEQAVQRTVATAGRTVLVSGVTVALALSSLMLFPAVFLRSMGYGGVATVAVDVIAALTVLPALLAVLGTRVNALAVRRSLRAGQAGAGQLKAETDGIWYRLARRVMRRPLAYAMVIVVVLLALGAPFLQISWGGVDARVLPSSSTVRQVAEQLTSEFPANSTAPIEILVSGATSQASMSGYARQVAAISGVTGVRVTGAHGGTARLDAVYASRPDSGQARGIVAQIRALTPPPHATVLVGGAAAVLVDELASLSATLPWMALFVAITTFVLLFLAFGSVVLPLKAIVMNVLSLSATLGVVVWVFQWGHLSGPLQFTATGTIDPTMPILLLAIVFGLSMDYEVFLLSRIRERYDETGDSNASVAIGLQRTGGLITSLALLLIVVVGLFSASGISFIKLLGVGMIAALVVDATIVRILLVPATMRLLGRANWWAPRPLRGLYARYGIREETASEAAPAQVLAND